MPDSLIHNNTLRWFIKTLSLPLPLPPVLKRSEVPYAKDVLSGYKVKVNGSATLGTMLQAAGATTVEGTEPVDAIVYDLYGPKTAAELDQLHLFFSNSLGQLKRNGRVLVVQRLASSNAEAAAAQRAVDGIVRTIAKEQGRKGITANRIAYTGTWQEMQSRIEGPLRFLLSRYAAFIDGQTIWLDNTVNAPEQLPLVKPLAGKTALVTGAARGIGAAIAKSLAREGAKVIVVDRPNEAEIARKLVAEINGELLLQDISAPDAPKALANFLEANKLTLDILVHNAGITRDKTLAKMDAERWEQVLNINFKAILRINEVLLPKLNEGGRMILMSSISGFSGNFGQANYAATKAALIGYADALAKEVSDRGITVNAIAPGFIETAMTAKMPLMTREGGRRLSNLQQGGLPEDIAEATLFLVSPGAVGVTGQTLRVCGGSMIGA
jgi:3-oxoacyl-[acyl-carrier protein] reductase